MPLPTAAEQQCSETDAEEHNFNAFMLLNHAILAHYCGSRDLLARLIGSNVPAPHRHSRQPVEFSRESTLARKAHLTLIFCGGVATLAARLVSGMRCRCARRLSACVIRRAAAARAAAAREHMFQTGLDLHRACRFAAAAKYLGLACRYGHLRAHAELSWLHSFGRDGVARDKARAFALAEAGKEAGCEHCKGALAYCLLYGHGCAEDGALARQLAAGCAAMGCSHGLFVLGKMHRNGCAGLKHDLVAAAAYYRAAAAQGLAEAQFGLGLMYQQGLMHEPGFPGASRYDEALRWYGMAAAGGQPSALHAIGAMYEGGRGVEASTAVAVEWFLRAHAAGDSAARDALLRHRTLLLRAPGCNL